MKIFALLIAFAYAIIVSRQLFVGVYAKRYQVAIYIVIFLGTVVFIYEWIKEEFFYNNIGQNSLYFIYNPAYAAEMIDRRGEVSAKPDLGFAVNSIIIVMLMVFVFAAILVMSLKDIPVNKDRRAAADNIVKTFGGFLLAS